MSMRSATTSALSQRAFTLVEMLVVVGVIVVLVGLLVPALAGVQRQSRAANDLATLRSLSVAHAGYMNAHKDHFVDVGLPHGGIGSPNASFVTTLRPFLDHPVALRSPLDQSSRWSADQGGTADPALGPVRITSYGMNNHLSRNYSPLAAIEGPGAGSDRLGEIQRPAEMVCFLLMTEEGDFALADHPHVETWCGLSDEQAPTIAATQVAITAVDRQRPARASLSNYAFLDGHCRTHEFDDLWTNCERNRFDPQLQ